MSAYDDVPAHFPLNVDIKRRPVTFTLEISTGDKVIYTLMSLFWLAFIPAMIMIQVIDRSYPAWVFNTGVAISLAYVALAGRFWLWRNIASALTRVTVTIGEETVEVEQWRLFARRRWREPLANFSGIGIEAWGTHLVDGAKVPLSAILIRHPDESRSIPLVIDVAKKVTVRRAAERARVLGLALIEGIAASVAGGTLPEGTVVRNRWQAFKVQALSLFFLGIIVIFSAITALQYLTATVDQALPILAAIMVLPLAGMHYFARRYVVSLWQDPATGTCYLRTAALTGNRHILAPADFASARRNEGKMYARTSVHAPWITLRLGDGRSFIVDVQSEYVDEGFFERLNGAA